MKTVFASLLGLVACLSMAKAEIPDCEALAERAARMEGVPAGILSAIARVESGQTVQGVFRAWPWTLNQAGQGHYLGSKPEALAVLDAALAAGRRNIDVGCMQINWHWHGAQFATLSQMIDPVENTRYAARYLRDLHQKLGDWELAIMRYHSADRVRGQAYAQRVRRQMRGALQADNPAPAQPRRAREAGHLDGLLAHPGTALVALENARPLMGQKMHSR
jgi:hypothetical protein